MSKLQDLQEFLAAGESDLCAWQRSTRPLRRIGETLCAFLNGRGGRVLVGVTAQGEVRGEAVTDETQQAIGEMLALLDPPALVDLEEVWIEGAARVLVFLVNPSPEDRPYSFDGESYQREGRDTVRMLSAVHQRLVQERCRRPYAWEGKVAHEVGLEHLDHARIVQVATRGIRAGRLPQDFSHHPDDILGHFGLVTEEGQLRNAAVALFANPSAPGRRLLQCSLEITGLWGSEPKECRDAHQAMGGALHLMEEAESFVQRHLPVAVLLEPHPLDSKEVRLLPWRAVREALANAFIHRDYAGSEGAVEIAIYDDRMEVWNPGGLLSGARVDQIKRHHTPDRRNARMAEVFYRSGLVDEYTHGTREILERCCAVGRPEPQFVVSEGRFGVILFAPFSTTPPLQVA